MLILVKNFDVFNNAPNALMCEGEILKFQGECILFKWKTYKCEKLKSYCNLREICIIIKMYNLFKV